MRVAALSDVHGNVLALEAVLADLARQEVDLVVVAGDLVSQGPRPAEALDMLREALPDAVTIGGNSERRLLATIAGQGAPLGDGPANEPAHGPATVEDRAERRASSDWTLGQLGPERIGYLAGLPPETRFVPAGASQPAPSRRVPAGATPGDGARTGGPGGAAEGGGPGGAAEGGGPEDWLVVHGSPGADEVGIWPATATGGIERLAWRVLVCGHTHHPFHREVQAAQAARDAFDGWSGTGAARHGGPASGGPAPGGPEGARYVRHLVNDGSVAWPLDGDLRPSYAVMDLGETGDAGYGGGRMSADIRRVDIRRVDYDRERVVADLEQRMVPWRGTVIHYITTGKWRKHMVRT
ncbi:MAG: metallophosphoesterase family protein [Acidimicrobiales bacterium]